MYTYNFLIPSNLNIDAHLNRYPVEIPHFRMEKLLYCMHIITEIPARNKDHVNPGGYVAIYTPILHDMIGDRYHLYLNYLVQTGIFLAKKQYSPGSSRKYKFDKPYNEVEVRPYKANVSKWLIEKLEGKMRRKASKSGVTQSLDAKLPVSRAVLSLAECAEYDIQMRVAFPEAFKWYDLGKLMIDFEGAKKHCRTLLKYRVTGFFSTEKRYNRVKKRLIEKDSMQQLNSALVTFTDIENKNYRARFDTNVFRQYSVLTSIPKEFRPYLSWEGNKLVSIDICNSQPYLLTALLNPEFWTLTKEQSKLSIYNLPYSNNYVKSYPISILIMLSNFLKDNATANVTSYKEVVSQGKLYEYMAKHIGTGQVGSSYSRDDIKRKMFMVMFTENNAITQNWAKLKREFARLFPDVYRVIELIQSMGSNMLPSLLQRIESFIFYHKVLPRIATEYPDLPVFTIHDSLVTLKGYEDNLKAILQQELEKATGLAPTCKVELWNKEDVVYELLENETMYECVENWYAETY